MRIPLSVPTFRGNEIKYLTECVETGWVSTAGRFVTDFEKKTAEFNRIGHGVAMSSGTGALHTALLVLGIGAGDEVLVPTLTFIAPINAVRYTGAEPVFMDSDDFINIDPQKINEFCSTRCTHTPQGLINNSSGRRLRAILPVHIFGNPVDIDPMVEVASRYGLHIIEDATESLGSFYTSGQHEGRMTGTVGDIGCYSFNGNKIITSGGGGMLVTNIEQHSTRARYLSTQARDNAETYMHNEVGYNYRMTNVEAAVGMAQLEVLSEYVTDKHRIFALYNELLADIEGVRLLESPPYASSNHWLNAVIVDSTRTDRDAIMNKLLAQGIEARPLWLPNHMQKPYTGVESFRLERAMTWHRQVLNIPSSVGLSEEHIKEVADAIRQAAQG